MPQFYADRFARLGVTSPVLKNVDNDQLILTTRATMKALTYLAPLLLAGCALISGCASMDRNSASAPPGLEGADVTTRTEANGDVIQEYRLAGGLKAVKITPVRGPAYYMYDQDGDGKLDRTSGAPQKDVSPVYWKLYSW